MAGIVTIREEYLTDIADAIREQTDSEMPLTTDNMAPAIRSIERGANVDLSDYATIEYVDEQIAAVGGGSSLAADNETIIEENGVIRTAIGGAKVTLVESSLFTSNTGSWHSSSGNEYIRMSKPSGVSNLDADEYIFNITVQTAATSEENTYSLKGVKNQINASYHNYLLQDNPHLFYAFGDYNDYNHGLYFKTSSDAYPFISEYTIINYEIVTVPVYEYKKIDSNFINTDDSIAVSANGALSINYPITYDKDNKTYRTQSKIISMDTYEYSPSTLTSNHDQYGAFSVGRENTISSNGYFAGAIGSRNDVSGSGIAIGDKNEINGNSVNAFGDGLISGKSSYQSLYGTYNESDADAAVIIGCGDNSTRKNGLVISADQVAHFPGSITIGANKDEVATKAYIDEVLGVIEDGYY